ncbi:hypothetical protein QWZ13_19410 [Reinekea marina]|uniref:PilZ domain-containing protein n=1 Tax=Reinekea marina TaxID=1310421 RepID=A0ABV7WR09_9GAMM|nr:PilZ domain-containing protein [Reinekea marina]MDN3647328.1 hypothetical protein [Reinekea marina]MDN3651084.1 hypothetical protein [Reinekea marina]
MTESRAPRCGQLEIPLTLVTQDNQPLVCSCINISSTGAYLRPAEPLAEVKVGTMFQTKMLKRGTLTSVSIVVERVEADGFAVRFV